MVDFAQPIEVIDVFGRATPAEYVHHQLIPADCYEILWRGKKWVVDADHRIQGPIDAIRDFRVRNRLS